MVADMIHVCICLLVYCWCECFTFVGLLDGVLWVVAFGLCLFVWLDCRGVCCVRVEVAVCCLIVGFNGGCVVLQVCLFGVVWVGGCGISVATLCLGVVSINSVGMFATHFFGL